jgi:hypothetical protein
MFLRDFALEVDDRQAPVGICEAEEPQELHAASIALTGGVDGSGGGRLGSVFDRLSASCSRRPRLALRVCGRPHLHGMKSSNVCSILSRSTDGRKPAGCRGPSWCPLISGTVQCMIVTT